MNYVRIGGEAFDVIVESISENFNILFSNNTGRSLAAGARMVLDPLGTFYGHKVVFRRKSGKENEFDRLFMFLSKPRYDGVVVEIVHNQSTLNYEAYVSSGERELRKIDPESGKVYWSSFEANFIPMEAQVLPE